MTHETKFADMVAARYFESALADRWAFLCRTFDAVHDYLAHRKGLTEQQRDAVLSSMARAVADRLLAQNHTAAPTVAKIFFERVEGQLLAATVDEAGQLMLRWCRGFDRPAVDEFLGFVNVRLNADALVTRCNTDGT